MDRRDMSMSASAGTAVSLRFEDKRASATSSKSTLDSRVEELLASMPVYGSPTFQPLTRALEILSSPRADEELARLRSDWQEVDALVDHVVALHHVEFTTSLQEYSRVVTLLKEVHACINEVRRCLSVAMDGVRVEEEGLVRVTKEYAEMVEVRKMLAMIGDVVDAISEVENEVQMSVDMDAGVETKGRVRRWPSSHHVNRLLKAGNTLAREEMRTIPATRGLVERAKTVYQKLVALLVREVKRQAFFARGPGYRGAGDMPRAVANEWSMGHVVPVLASFSIDQDLISCVAQLGAVEDALEAIRDGARSALRAELIRVVHTLDMSDGQRGNETPLCVAEWVLRRSEAFFGSTCLCVQRLLEEHVSAPSSGLALIRGDMVEGAGVRSDATGTPRASIAGMARRMVGSSSSTVGQCRLLWESVQRELLHVLAAVLGLSVQSKSSMENVGPDDETNMFLDSIRRTNSVDHQQGLVFSVDDQVGRGRDAEYAEYAEYAGVEDGKRDACGASWEMNYSTGDLERAVKGAIGEESCSVRASPALFRPVKSFVSGCLGHLDEIGAAERKRIGQVASTSSPSLPSSPSSMSILDRIQANFSRVTLQLTGDSQGTGDKRDGPEEFLLSYLVDILRTDFIPSVYVDCGQRSQVVVTGMAGSIRTHTVATYVVAQNTVALIRDMFDWCAKAPVIACDLIGILENALGKIAESLRSQACSVGAPGGVHEGSSQSMDTLGKKSDGLQATIMAQDPKLSHMMAQEPIATLVGGPEWFVCRDTATMDSFLTSAIASGFALGKQVLPEDLTRYFLDLIPFEGSSLLLQSNNANAIKSVVSIAVVGQTAELIANGMYESMGTLSEKTRDKNKGGREPRGTVSSQGPKFIGLVDVANRFRAVSGFCTRALRIEAMLTILFAMQPVLIASGKRHEDTEQGAASDDEMTRVLQDFAADVAQVAPKLTTMDEVLSNHIPVSLRQYIFGSLPKFLETVAGQIEGTDLDQRTGAVARALSAVEPVLNGLGGRGEFAAA